LFEDVVKKLRNDEELNSKEANLFLMELCKDIRKYYCISDPMSPDCKLCYECATSFGGMALMKYGCDVEGLNVKEKLDIPLTHYANFIRLYVDGNVKTYLVDMTYSQFFGDYIVLDGKNGVNGKTIYKEKVFSKLENEKFVQELRKNGFVELNEDILKKYIDGFLDVCNVKDKKSAYSCVNKLTKMVKIKSTSRR